MTSHSTEQDTSEHSGQNGRTPLYGPEFAADPRRIYAQLRSHGPTAPVEIAPGIPATLVTSYQAALEVLRDPATFPKDPRRWQQKVPPDCPVLPMMMYRQNCLFTDGAVHTRLRKAMSDSLGRVDVRDIRSYVETSADTLIDEFAFAGEADLLLQYARILPLLVLNRMCGTPPAIGDRILTGMMGIFDGIDAEKSNEELVTAISELVALKRLQPAADVASWMMEHPARLADEELVHQHLVLMGAGCEPQQNLIANTLRLLLSDDRFGGDLAGGSLPVEEALDEVLWTDPPMANYGTTYPVQEAQIGGNPVPADEPVLISFAAANTDPTLVAGHGRVGNRAHLAFSAGPHTCPTPAQRMARVIASAAIEKLLDRLPDIELAVPADTLKWRPGPFHRALEALPVRFPPPSAPVQPDSIGDGQWSTSPVPTSSTRPAETSKPKPRTYDSEGQQRWWNYPAKWLRGR
ncbi:cytochrome P450 [Saccharopolyspora sp. K220]|uniref:cytochrome P450 n=1 Tax=Saccharopolyspora soli TaxID=2926618 RepID=UPI001F5746C9|nr:cytochrome P450 [Saccharopolyspora soli]MCI2423603.1 cytochrome P450 [Saccharopolyspora soli]